MQQYSRSPELKFVFLNFIAVASSFASLHMIYNVQFIVFFASFSYTKRNLDSFSSKFYSAYIKVYFTGYFITFNSRWFYE